MYCGDQILSRDHPLLGGAKYLPIVDKATEIGPVIFGGKQQSILFLGSPMQINMAIVLLDYFLYCTQPSSGLTQKETFSLSHSFCKLVPELVLQLFYRYNVILLLQT